MGISATQAGYLQLAHGSVPLLLGVRANTPVISVPSATFEMHAPVPVVAAQPAPVHSPGWALPPVPSRVADAVGLAAGAGAAIFHGAGEVAHHAAFAVQRADFVTLGIAALVALAAREGVGWLVSRGRRSERTDYAAPEELLARAEVLYRKYNNLPMITRARRAEQLFVQPVLDAYRQAAEAFEQAGNNVAAATLYYEKIAPLQSRWCMPFSSIKPLVTKCRAVQMFLDEGDFDSAYNRIDSMWRYMPYEIKRGTVESFGMALMAPKIWRLHREIGQKWRSWLKTNQGSMPNVLVKNLLEKGLYEQAATTWAKYGQFGRAEKIFRTSVEFAKLEPDTLRRHEGFGRSARVAEKIAQAYDERELYDEAAAIREQARLACDTAASPVDRAVPEVPASEDTAPDPTRTRVPE